MRSEKNATLERDRDRHRKFWKQLRQPCARRDDQFFCGKYAPVRFNSRPVTILTNSIVAKMNLCDHRVFKNFCAMRSSHSSNHFNTMRGIQNARIHRMQTHPIIRHAPLRKTLHQLARVQTIKLRTDSRHGLQRALQTFRTCRTQIQTTRNRQQGFTTIRLERPP